MNAIIVMVVIGGLLGLILGIASEVFKVKIDERVSAVLEMLPGYNCGACGQPGCAGFAESLVNGSEVRVSGCKPSKADIREKIVIYLNESTGPNGEKVKVSV